MANKDEQRIEDIISELREMITEFDGELNLAMNPYGFVTAWLEGDDKEVWWDKDKTAFPMGELTELCALRDTIEETKREIANEG